MQTLIHNQLGDKEFEKVTSTIEYFCESHLEKHGDSDRWKLEAWCKEGDGYEQDSISCSLSLKRPGHKEIFAKKDARNFKTAAHNSVRAIEKALRRERTK